MHIVTDRGADLTPSQLEGLSDHITFAPLTITLDGRSYVSGVDIQHDEFYELLITAEGMPTTSLPSAGEFAEIYREIARTDPDILSVHISSGLSGTVNSARQAAEMVQEANITVFDTMTLSGAEGWQVEAAARAAKAGWTREKIVALLETIRDVTETIFTLPELKYLIHGGRISHLKGLLASVLNIKPIIGVSKEDGKYYQLGRARTFNRAVQSLADVIAGQHGEGASLRVQVLHAGAPRTAEQLVSLLDSRFDCTFLPTGDVAPVLGAHTGPGLVGAVCAPLDRFPVIP